jgi:hypothetical protein
MTSRYRHRRTPNPGTAFPSPIEPGEIAVNTANRQLAVGDATSGSIGIPLALIGVRIFDSRAQYAASDFVVQGGQLYRSKSAINPGPFTAAAWDVISTDVTLKTYIDAADSALATGKVSKAGDTMTGLLTLSADPTANLHAATKQYVDAGDTGSALLVSDTPPGSAKDGALWWESDSGLLYVYYFDGNTRQWVIAAPQPDLSTFVQKTGDTMTGQLTLPTGPAAANAVRKDYVDAGDVTLQASITALTSNKVSKAGDTMTGGLVISYASPTFVISKTGSGQDNLIYGMNGSLARWAIELGNGSAETGSNVGSDFAILRYNDAGAISDAPLTINRASATVSLSGSLGLPGGVTAGVFSLGGSGAGGQFFGDTNQTVVFTNGAGCFNNYAKTTGNWGWNVNNTQIMNLQYGGNGLLVVGGNGYKPGGGVWVDSSDIRIKTVEGEYKTGLDAVAKLRPVSFTFKGNDTPEPPAYIRAIEPEDKSGDPPLTVPYPNSPHYGAATSGKRFHGLIAQEVETVFPEMVTQREGYIDGQAVTDLRDIDTTPLLYALINAVKELKARIEVLEAV